MGGEVGSQGASGVAMEVHKESIVCMRPLWGLLSDSTQLLSTLTKTLIPNGVWHRGILIDKDSI